MFKPRSICFNLGQFDFLLLLQQTKNIFGTFNLLFILLRFISTLLTSPTIPPLLSQHPSPYSLRSTSSNASLILLRDYAELVSRCKVMLWKTHIPVRTQKWSPCLIFAGACHGIVINYVTALLLTMVMASKLVW